MNPRFLDVLHDARDVDVRAVGDGINVDLDGVLEVGVEEDRLGSPET